MIKRGESGFQDAKMELLLPDISISSFWQPKSFGPTLRSRFQLAHLLSSLPFLSERVDRMETSPDPPFGLELGQLLIGQLIRLSAHLSRDRALPPQSTHTLSSDQGEIAIQPSKVGAARTLLFQKFSFIISHES